MLIPIYTGIFLNSEEIYGAFPPKLSAWAGHPHVTLTFRGGIESAHEEFLGEEVKVRVVGYGNNGKNEGLKVELSANNSELQKICDLVAVPHITLSISRDGVMKNTSGIEFSPLEKTMEFTGRYGVVTHSGLVI